MGLHGDVELRDMRIIDETMDPPEGKDLRCCSSTRLVRVMNLTQVFCRNCSLSFYSQRITLLAKI
jgi:hypothetical protein